MHKIKVYRMFFLEAVDENHRARAFHEGKEYELDDIEFNHFYIQSVMKAGWMEVIKENPEEYVHKKLDETSAVPENYSSFVTTLMG